MNKTQVIGYLKNGGMIKVTAPTTHKAFNTIRKAEKVQTDGVRFQGGSWLYFNDIKPQNCFEKCFFLGDEDEGEEIKYEFVED